MASAPDDPPWVRDSPHEKGIVSESQRYSQLLIKNTARLCTTVVMAGLWMYLIALEVLDQSTKASLQGKGANEDQVQGLLEHLLKSPCWKLHGFVKALCESDQDHVVSQILLLNPGDYVGDQKEQHQTRHRKQLKKEIKEHREVYNRTLMQGSLFDIPSLDLPYDMEPCYVQIVATEDGLLRDPENILPADILKPKKGKPRLRTALLSGPPGAGKSAFIRFYAYKWSQTEEGSSQWDLIVILNVSTLRLTEGKSSKYHIMEAILQSLQGSGTMKAILNSLHDERLNILIIPDGMDECRSPMILEMLKELIFSCYKGKLRYTVLSTCRSGLSQIMESLYERRMKLDGFKTHEGLECVKRFYEKIQKPEDESTYEYIVNSTEELDNILTNPLCTHILSVVTSDGTLKLVQGQRLKLSELYHAMEKSMVRRQREKMVEGGSENTNNEKELEEVVDGNRNFYYMSLWALLKDVRTFDDSDFSLFGLDHQHPCFTFLKKIKYTSFLSHVVHWKFNHETFHEFFSICALEKLPDDLLSALLLIISSQRKFRNAQRILFSALGGDIDQVGKLSDMIRVNLITQEKSQKLDATTRKAVDDIKRELKDEIALDDLLTALIPGKEDEMRIDTRKAQAVWDKIKRLYEDQAELLQKEGLFYHILASSEDLIKHIYDCLHELPEKHQQLVFEQSLGHTFPSTVVDTAGDRHILYKTGGTRWAEGREYCHGVCIDLTYSLTDAADVVHQYAPHLLTLINDKGSKEMISIGLKLKPGLDVWGDKPYDQFLSSTQWSDLLSDMSEWPITARSLTPRFDGDLIIGVKGFLQCLKMKRTQDALRRLLVKDERGRLRIEVDKGHINSESLLAWTAWYLHQKLLVIQFSGLSYDVSRGKDVEHLKYKVHNGCKIFLDLKMAETPKLTYHLVQHSKEVDNTSTRPAEWKAQELHPISASHQPGGEQSLQHQWPAQLEELQMAEAAPLPPYHLHESSRQIDNTSTRPAEHEAQELHPISASHQPGGEQSLQHQWPAQLEELQIGDDTEEELQERKQSQKKCCCPCQ